MYSDNYNGPNIDNDAYIGLIHALPLNRWKGSDMIELALGIARALGVRRASLFDATFQKCEKEALGNEEGGKDAEILTNQKELTRTSAHKQEHGYDLSMIMLLSRQISFYGRYGFVPVINNSWDVANLDSDDPKKEICSNLAKLKRVKASSFKNYLRAMLHHLDKPQPTTGYRLVGHLYEFGVLQVRVLGVDEARTSLPTRVKIMKRLLEAFEPHDGHLLPLFGDGSKGLKGGAETLSCSAKADMLELLEMGCPILRIDDSRNRKAEKAKVVVTWPAWHLLEKLMRIRSMSMETVVHADPEKQKCETYCPAK